MFHRFSLVGCGLVFVATGSITAPAIAGSDDPFADVMVFFDAGVGGAPGYDNPSVALGSPERMSGKCFGLSDVVSAFSGPYCPNEIVSMGIGGELVLQFATPVTNDPNNLYGIDLLIFGNTSFIDEQYPNGIVGGIFSNDGGLIDVSANGVDWKPVAGLIADGPMPTIGYTDAGPYDQTPGQQLTDFTRPVDPLVTPAYCLGSSNAQVIEKYRGSGGGVGIDLAPTGLNAISYVRIRVPEETPDNVEIDAVADVAPRQPGDVNLDEAVNVADLLQVISAWGPTVPGGIPADFDLNGGVNVADLLIVIGHWGP